MNKKEVLDKIKNIEGLSQEDRAYLVNLINTEKKYGLVWEDKPEDVEEQLRTKLPILQEVKDRAIFNDDATYPNHTIIEGDNLHALTTLSFTHKNKIDLIYIDPPYNTGKKTEFKYNDKYVDEEDSFRHSKWLSFMHKRLKIAHELLADDGVMIISIDDHEVAQLKLMCDEIFNTSPNPKASNQIGFLIWDLSTGTQAGHFVRSHEYILVYAKNKALLPNFKGGEGVIQHSALKKIGVKNPASEFTFPKGTRFDAEDGIELQGSWGGSEKSTLIKGRMISEKGKLKEEVVISAGWAMKNQMYQYFYEDPQNTYDSKGQKVLEFYFNKSGVLTYRKEKSITNPPSVLREVASTKQGTTLLRSLFEGEEPIQFVKPIQLIQWFLSLMPEKKTILDFFAGSGTTLHSVMEQNKIDGGSRKCIITTNNENGIAEKVAYVRNKNVIKGYESWKNGSIKALSGNNLRYYKTGFVDRQPSLSNKRQLTKLATELLCIKEDCYLEVNHQLSFTPEQAKIFTNNDGKYLIAIYHSRNQLETQETLISWIDSLEDVKENVRLYAFSPEKEVLAEEFYEVANKVDVVPLPDAIYNAYLSTIKSLKTDKKQMYNPNTAEA